MYHNQNGRLTALFLVTFSSGCLQHCGIRASRGIPALNATCNIPVLPGLSIREFQASFKGRHPVIFGRTVSESEVFRNISSYEYLVEHMGSVEIELASSNSFSHDRIRVKTREYLESINNTSDGTARANETFYFFGGNNRGAWATYLANYKHPLDSAFDDPALSFGCAGKLSGVSFHTHGAAFSESLHGSKYWYLYPPGDRPPFDGDASQLSWVTDIYPEIANERPAFECTVPAGMVIYIPPHWFHATLNLHAYNAFISTFTREPAYWADRPNAGGLPGVSTWGGRREL